jgi:hypothetical protein
MLLAAATAATLLARMATVNAGLNSFTATMHAHVAMHSLPYLTVDLTGTYYHKEPDKNKIVFSSGLPLVAQQFDKLYAHIESPAQWERLYLVTMVADDGTTAKLKLVPRKTGNVASIDATVDDRDATVRSLRWNYANGGDAEMTNHYSKMDGYFVVQSQAGQVSEPGYNAEITTTMDGYKLNPPLADSLFAQ